jgi:hypothetical protein
MSAAEALIADIWTKLVRVSRPLGRTDRFFEIGGHSMLALEALRQVEERVGRQIPLGAMFQETIAEMAARLNVPDTATPPRSAAS